MPKLRTENFGAGDQTWLGSTHGIRNARTAVIDISTFTAATHYPDGYLRSGTEVNAANEAAVTPYTGAAGEQLGYLLTDQKVNGAEDFGAPILRHGIINISKLPIAHVASTGASEAGFTFVGGNA
ncbi:head decoration protein [Microbacterium sp. KNMS]